MATKQQPRDGMTYDEMTHQWVPVDPAKAAAPQAPAEPATPAPAAKKE
jgi:hypothetical protein